MNPCPSVLETAILPLNYFPEIIKYIVEIKYRIIFIFITLVTSMLTLIKYRYYLINLILETCPELQRNTTKYFILTSITELFDVFFNTWLLIIGHILFYFTCYHIISFMSWGLYKKEYNDFKCFFVNSFYLCIASIFVFLQEVLPLTYIFFFEFKQKSDCKHFKLYFEPKLDTYLNFTINIYIQCCFIFQLMLIMIFLINYTKTTNYITKFRKTIYISTLITATVITPPDIWSQLTLFLLLIMFFEIYLVKITFNNNLKLIKEYKQKN